MSTPNPVTVTWCSECGARVVLSHDPVPFWVKRAMERMSVREQGKFGDDLADGLWDAGRILREEAAKDNVEL